METGIIKFNIRERGRTVTGKTRDYDTREVFSAINSEECQESVKNGDLIGFYGHFPRVRYGTKPAEGGIEDGRYVTVEPAFVTTYLKAYQNGDIEHKARFLETNSGKLAGQLMQENVGGFSSVIEEYPDKTLKFIGFDYVAVPNYLNNSFRGLQLDSAFLYLDDLNMTSAEIYIEELKESQAYLLATIEQLKNQNKAAQETIQKLYGENQELIDYAAGKIKTDSVTTDEWQPPLIVNFAAKNRFLAAQKQFKTATLPQIESDTKVDHFADMLTGRFSGS